MTPPIIIMKLLTCNSHSNFLPLDAGTNTERAALRHEPAPSSPQRESYVSRLRLDDFLRWQPNDPSPIRGNRTLRPFGWNDPSAGPPGEARSRPAWVNTLRPSAEAQLMSQAAEHNGKPFRWLHINQHGSVSQGSAAEGEDRRANNKKQRRGSGLVWDSRGSKVKLSKNPSHFCPRSTENWFKVFGSNQWRKRNNSAELILTTHFIITSDHTG